MHVLELPTGEIERPGELLAGRFVARLEPLRLKPLRARDPGATGSGEADGECEHQARRNRPATVDAAGARLRVELRHHPLGEILAGLDAAKCPPQAILKTHGRAPVRPSAAIRASGADGS